MERASFTDHGASSCSGNEGLWAKLLEKAKRGTSGGEPYFAVDIEEGNLSSMFAKLGLPASFSEHHRKNLTENILLEGPDGRKWPVMLGQSWDSQPCLLSGWREFATDCNLAVNDQIVFFLWETSHFLVQIFDSNHNIERSLGESDPNTPAYQTPLPQVPAKTTPPSASPLTGTNVNYSLPQARTAEARSSASSLPTRNNNLQKVSTTEARPSASPLPTRNNNLQKVSTTEARPSATPLSTRNNGPRQVTTKTIPSAFPLPSSEVSPNVTCEDNLSTQATRSRVMPGDDNQLQEFAGYDDDNDDFRELEFAVNFGELLGLYPDPPSAAPSSDEAEEQQEQEEQQGLNMNRKTLRNQLPNHKVEQGLSMSGKTRSDFLQNQREGREQGGKPINTQSNSDPFAPLSSSSLSIADYIGNPPPDRRTKPYRAMRREEVEEDEKIPKKRPRQAPTDRSNIIPVIASISKKQHTKKIPSTSTDSRAAKVGLWSARAVREAARGGAATVATAATVPRSEGASTLPRTDPVSPLREATAAIVPRSEATPTSRSADPLTPVPVEAAKPAFKRPRPPTPARRKVLSKRQFASREELLAALDAGQQYAVNSYSKTVVMQMRIPHVYCGLGLPCPSDFASRMELPEQGRHLVILFDMTGKTWPVEWHGDHPRISSLGSEGWTRFSLEHFLEEGDVCVFELPEPKQPNIAVHVFRALPLRETTEPREWRKYYHMLEPNLAVEAAQATTTVVGQATPSSEFESQGSGMQGKLFKLNIDLNSENAGIPDKQIGAGKEGKSSEDDKSNVIMEKSCMDGNIGIHGGEKL